VVAPQFGEPFVQRVGQHVVVVRGGLEEPVAEGLEPELTAHASQGRLHVIKQPSVTNRAVATATGLPRLSDWVALSSGTLTFEGNRVYTTTRQPANLVSWQPFRERIGWVAYGLAAV
jgi:hypothetical protein